MNQNLVSTTIVDKNGVVTTRHKKPETTPTSTKAAIPAVSLPVIKAPITEVAKELMMGRQAEDYLVMIEDDHEGTISLWNRLLTTGSEQARETVKFVMNDATHSIKSALENEDDGYDWTEDCSDAWFPHSVTNTLRLWNHSNVIAEVGGDHNDIELAYRTFEYMLEVPELSNVANEDPETDEYWRGLAAMTITDMDVTSSNQDRSELLPFVEWAGRHPDIKRVVETARSRQTFNVGVLKAIFSEQDKTASAIRDGVL